MAKGGREKIKLESTAGTGHFYTTNKNKKTTPEKLEFMKYDPKVRKHVMYKEVKLKSLRHAPQASPPRAGFLIGSVRELPAAGTGFGCRHPGSRARWQG